MYTVTVHHHDKDWRNGDLEDKFELEASENFKTRKAAKEWILRHARGRGSMQQKWHKGDHDSYVWCHTGMTWIHENTGEEMEEYYQYRLSKARIH